MLKRPSTRPQTTPEPPVTLVADTFDAVYNRTTPEYLAVIDAQVEAEQTNPLVSRDLNAMSRIIATVCPHLSPLDQALMLTLIMEDNAHAAEACAWWDSIGKAEWKGEV